MILAVLLLVGGIIYLSVDIYNRHKREAVIEDAATNMDQVIAQNAAVIEAAGGDDSAVAEPVMTLIVDPSELEVNGEEYDFYDDDYYIQQALNAQRNQVNQEMDDTYTGYLTLQGVGMLDIPCIDLHVPIWETTNSDTLRYGVGHYVNSVSPGAVGNCTITGHHMLKYGSIFNRLEEVEEISDIEPVDLSTLLTQTASTFDEVLRNKNVGRINEIAPGVVYNGNRAQMERLFSVLIENASKYVDEYGKVRLTLKKESKNTVFSVFNSCQIDRDVDYSLLFDRFYRPDSSRTSSTGGHGIGLSIAKRIVTLHSGTIEAQPSDTGLSINVRLSNKLKPIKQKKVI